MKAPYNKMARAYFVLSDGTTGPPIGDAFPCRVPAAGHIANEGGLAPGPWIYMTCSRLFILPTLTIEAGTCVVVADYLHAAAIAIPDDAPPTWLAISGQLVTPWGQTSYYRYTLAPYPFG